MDRSSKQRINKETQTLNETLDQMDLIDIFRTFHPNTEEYTLFSSAHGTFSRIDHILGHKSSLSKCKKIEIVSIIFSDHNIMKLDINYKGKKRKTAKTNYGEKQRLKSKKQIHYIVIIGSSLPQNEPFIGNTVTPGVWKQE